MPPTLRLRRLAPAALTVALALFVAGCVENPNSIFHSRTEFNRDVGALFELLLWLGTAVFVFTEVLLVYALFRFRHRPGTPRQPEQTHGNTRLEILWTVIPAVVLAVIAVPTVQTVFKTQGDAGPDALQVEVIGHQWWWEFRYPQYNITTANEVYLPLGRTVNFALTTTDVIHSFWIPALGGKRDNVNNRTNHLWFTPDSTTEDVFNGVNSKAARTIPKETWAVTRRKLDALNAATDVGDLRQPPGNRLEALKGDMKGRYSIRVNEQYRITFRFDAGHADDVRCEDYH